jgi:hypothetical protein
LAGIILSIDIVIRIIIIEALAWPCRRLSAHLGNRDFMVASRTAGHAASKLFAGLE